MFALSQFRSQKIIRNTHLYEFYDAIWQRSFAEAFQVLNDVIRLKPNRNRCIERISRQSVLVHVFWSTDGLKQKVARVSGLWVFWFRCHTEENQWSLLVALCVNRAGGFLLADSKFHTIFCAVPQRWRLESRERACTLGRMTLRRCVRLGPAKQFDIHWQRSCKCKYNTSVAFVLKAYIPPTVA